VSPGRLDALVDRQPHWRPWIRLLSATRRAIEDRAWARHLTDGADGAPPDAAPRLAGAVLAVEDRLARRWVREILATAAEDSAPAGPFAAAARRGALDELSLLEASLNEDRARVEAVAHGLGLDPAPLHAVVPLLAMPLLHGYRRTRTAPAGGYDSRSCPTCGAWPTFAELRGLERRRHLRCARCGDDWEAVWLSCPFCGERDHARLGSLVPETTRESRRIETCSGCRGYLKTFATLTATDPVEVMVEDLLSIELDVAALQHGYARPAGPGRALGGRIVAAGRERRGLFAWR
jgi:FdhE protein